jgi:ADYC domain
MASRKCRCAALIAATLVAASGDARSEAGPPPSATTVVEVTGTTLRARRPDGSSLEGAALVGSVLVVARGGETLRVRIADVEHDARDPRGEVLLYDFRVVAPDGAEEPLCRPDPDGRRLGLPLAGRSDSAGILRPGAGNEFELVCTAGARGKCVRFGYAPWRETPDGRPMLDWYNACVRMMRGDYCGDGRPFTRDGTIIDIYDRIGVQRSDGDPSFRFEAVWGPGGALCVAHPRIPEIVDLEGLGRACPRLAAKLGPAACNEDAPGGLLINRSR